MRGKPRWLRLGTMRESNSSQHCWPDMLCLFGADVCHSFLRRRGVRQMLLLQSRAIPMRRSYQFSSRRRQITSPPGSLENELKIYGAQSPQGTFSIMLWNPISCVLWPLGNFVSQYVILWFNCRDIHIFFSCNCICHLYSITSLDQVFFLTSICIMLVRPEPFSLYRGKSESSEHNFFLQAYM